MLTRPGVAALAAACLVGVAGWPVLGVIVWHWLSELAPTQALFWVAGMVIATACELQAQLTRRLLVFLDPRR
jgi:hypothetical protein